MIEYENLKHQITKATLIIIIVIVHGKNYCSTRRSLVSSLPCLLAFSELTDVAFLLLILTFFAAGPNVLRGLSFPPEAYILAKRGRTLPLPFGLSFFHP
jgi:hypothetical protein